MPTANHAPSNDVGRSSYASLLNKHALQDTFRHLHRNKREYTRNHIAHGVTLSKSRIDGIFISRALLEDHTHSQESNYRRLTESKHIYGTQEDLCAIRVDCNAKGNPAAAAATKQPLRWSDHCAVQITIQYTDTDTTSPPLKWAFPRYLLDSPKSVTTMRNIIEAHIPDYNNINEPTKTLYALLTEITEWAKKTSLEEKTKNTKLKKTNYLPHWKHESAS